MDEMPIPGNDDQAATAAIRMLVVDDDALIRRMARHVLEATGAAVVEAASGEEACATFATEADSWSAVIVDLTMPGIDGIETVERMRAIRRDVPVVLCSGWAAEDVADRLVRVPNAVFVAKPYRAAELVNAVATARRKAATR